MKRSYEERVYLASRAHHAKKNKPHRNEFGLHKTKRHYEEEIIERLLEEEVEEELR